MEWHYDIILDPIIISRELQYNDVLMTLVLQLDVFLYSDFKRFKNR